MLKIPMALLALAAVSSADGENFPSPNKAYAVVATADGNRNDSYAVLHRKERRTLATCPDDARFSGTPTTVVWSADSTLVAIHTRESRHGGAADIWLIGKNKGELIDAAYPNEDGEFYFTPNRWLNKRDLEFYAIGLSQRDSARGFKTYRFVMRVNRQARSAFVLRKTAPIFSGSV